MKVKGRYRVTPETVWHTVMVEHNTIEELKPYSIAAKQSLRDYLTQIVRQHLLQQDNTKYGGANKNENYPNTN